MNGQSGLVQKTTLENGVRVITDSMPGVRSISMACLLDTGPRDERPNEYGISHLLEHVVFSGTHNRDARQIAQVMDMGGGSIGAFTTRDYTCFYATVLDDYRTYALDLLGDILLNSIFPPENVEREQNAIVHEIAARRDSPEQRANDLLKAYAWPDHWLGRPITGTAETVRAITREDIIYFMHANYLPDRLIFAAAGNVEHADMVAQVRDAFWRMLGTNPKRTTTRPIFQPGIAIQSAPVSQVYFSLGLKALPYAAPDRYGLHVLTSILGGGISSRLYRRLREERGLVYSIDSEYHAYGEQGMLVVEGSTAPEHLIQVLGLTLVELWQFITGSEPPQDDELWKTKMQIRGQHLISGENTSTRMSRLATQELYFGRDISTQEVLDHIEAVDAGMLEGMAGNFLIESLKNVAIAVVGPESPECYSTALLQEMLAEFA